MLGQRKTGSKPGFPRLRLAEDPRQLGQRLHVRLGEARQLVRVRAQLRRQRRDHVRLADRVRVLASRLRLGLVAQTQRLDLGHDGTRAQVVLLGVRLGLGEGERALGDHLGDHLLGVHAHRNLLLFVRSLTVQIYFKG